MAVVWSISINGGASSTLSALGVRTAVRSLQSLAVSELRLVVSVADIFAVPAFAFGQTVRLFRDGLCWFVGTVSQVESVGASGDEAYSVIVSDGWWNLERRIYQQLIVTKQGNPPNVLSAVRSSRVVLGKDAFGGPLPTSAVIADIISQAGFASAPVLPPLVQGYFVEARDITLAEAIRRMLAITPDTIGWFDYSSGAPLFHVARRAALGVFNYDLNLPDKKIEMLALVPRNDLLINGVVLTYITSQTDADNSTWLQYTQDVAGITAGDAVLFAHIELAAQGTERAEVPPLGLANNFFSSYNVLQWEGSIRLHEADCSGLMALGNKVNLLNGRAAWAAMNAVVAGVVEDITNGVTEISFGSPPGLGLEDFVDMMRVFRNRPPPTSFPATQDNGTEGIPPAQGGTGPKPGVPTPTPNPASGVPPPIGIFPYVDVQICDAGTERTVRLIGLPLNS